MTEESSFTQKLSENMWLAALPVAGTYLAFLFQSSYFSYFGVPMSMVDIDIPKIIFSMAAIVIAAVIYLMLLAFVVDLFRAKNPIVRVVGQGLLTVAIFLPIILAASSVFTTRQLMFQALVLIGLWAVNGFWVQPQKSGESRSYLERLGDRLDNERSALKAKPTNVKEVVGTSIIGPFSLLMFGSLYVVMLGAYCASAFGGTMYLKSNMNALYVDRSDDAYIFTIVDPETNTYDNNVVLIDAGQSIELIRSSRKASRAP